MSRLRGARIFVRSTSFLRLKHHRYNNLTSSALLSSSSTQGASTWTPENDFFTVKFSALLNWYEEVTGLKDVRIAQDKVLKAEDKFIAAQDARREVNKQLVVVRDKLRQIYSELDQTARGQDRYVLLITQEHQILKEERKLVEMFNQYEREERENFAALSSAVKESHEKERAQAERTKYWSVIGSIIGTMIGVAGSSINNEFKMRELRRLVKESAQATITSRQEVDLPRNLFDVAVEIKDAAQKLAQIPSHMVTEFQTQNRTLQANVQELQTILKENTYSTSGRTVVNIEEMLDSQRRENRIIALICFTTAIALFCVSRAG